LISINLRGSFEKVPGMAYSAADPTFVEKKDSSKKADAHAGPQQNSSGPQQELALDLPKVQLSRLV